LVRNLIIGPKRGGAKGFLGRLAFKKGEKLEGTLTPVGVLRNFFKLSGDYWNLLGRKREGVN